MTEKNNDEKSENQPSGIAKHADKTAQENSLQIEHLRQIWESQHTKRRTNFTLNIAIPVLSALIISLGTWVWRTNQEIVILRSELNQLKNVAREQINHLDDKITSLSSATHDRYTGTNADRDRQEMMSNMNRIELRLSTDLDRLEDRHNINVKEK